MTTPQKSRILTLKKQSDTKGQCVVYIMSRDQRVADNHALFLAQSEALEHKLPLIVLFNLLPNTGHRRREHYEFMIVGLKKVEQRLQTLDIPFVVTIGDVTKTIPDFIKKTPTRSVYFDFNPLRGVRAAQKSIATNLDCAVYVIDTHNIVPVWVISDHEEYAAHTLRRKLHRGIEPWLIDPGKMKKHPHTLKSTPDSASWSDVDKIVQKIKPSGIELDFTSGETAAEQRLTQFIEHGLEKYADGRNDATADFQSDLSPYLHYGQISSLRVMLDVMDSSAHPPQLLTSFKMPSYEGKPSKSDGIDAFTEELVVRKELSDNYCFYQPKYDSIEGARDWARKTLEKHADDPRETLYNRSQLEKAETHDELWNAAQLQLTKSGKIHGYMRMYWAKKILEWSESPDEAIQTAIYLNDSYTIDGGDPNGYVGIMWSIAGVHDRPWFDRDIYGTVRYMARSGADKKFDTAAYIKRWTNN